MNPLSQNMASEVFYSAASRYGRATPTANRIDLKDACLKASQQGINLSENGLVRFAVLMALQVGMEPGLCQVLIIAEQMPGRMRPPYQV